MAQKKEAISLNQYSRYTPNIGTGSYPEGDVTLLLEKTNQPPVSVAEKERLIASGLAHYSDLITCESAPSKAHWEAFEYAMHEAGGAQRLARDVIALAYAIAQEAEDKPIVLISLVRAGVPLGVLLKRTLNRIFPDMDIAHYGVSIIRDRGIDKTAMQHIMAQHPEASYQFVDGWTGKGAIATQLKKALSAPDLSHIPYSLVVASDPAGVATLSASHDDWLIPFGILGSVVSGLTSRTLWSDDGYHRAAIYEHLSEHDISAHFADQIEQRIVNTLESYSESPIKIESGGEQQRNIRCMDVIHNIKERFDIPDINKIKPGIAEATRALLRRIPDTVIVHDKNDPLLRLVMNLAKDKDVPVIELKDNTMGPYFVVVLIS